MNNLRYIISAMILIGLSYLVEVFSGYNHIDIVFMMVVVLFVVLFIASGVLISGDRIRTNSLPTKTEDNKFNYRKIFLIIIPMIIYIALYYYFL